MDERDVVSEPEMMASISLPFVEARACSNEPRCLESLGLLETKNMFLTRGLERPADLLFVLSWSLASACHVGFECLGHWLVACIADHAA